MPPAKKATRKPSKKVAKKSTRRGSRTLTKAHLAALATGRTETATVNRYLTAIDRPKSRGRKTDTSPARLSALNNEIAAASGARKLELVQRKLDLARLAKQSSGPDPDVAKLEREFVKVAKSYAARKGISYGAFRALGVPADVLARARIARTRNA